ncbi:hypothetical protein R1sor_023037 [Riccia sorocarpa]|uniref:Protein MOR1 n=1 Tax=Riccia sorocarpa TaxID=122646 RepID=A0ABD3GQH0_9MARC
MLGKQSKPIGGMDVGFHLPGEEAGPGQTRQRKKGRKQQQEVEKSKREKINDSFFFIITITIIINQVRFSPSFGRAFCRRVCGTRFKQKLPSHSSLPGLAPSLSLPIPCFSSLLFAHLVGRVLFDSYPLAVEARRGKRWNRVAAGFTRRAAAARKEADGSSLNAGVAVAICGVSWWEMVLRLQVDEHIWFHENVPRTGRIIYEKLLKECKKLSWEDRLAHKNWKVRVDANTDIAAVCETISDPKDPKLKDFGPLFKKAIADANAPAQEKALDALIAYQRVVDADSGRYAKETCDSVVVKCLTGRPKTIEKAQTVLLLWVELEATEAFLDAMEKAVKNKVAKAVVPAIDVLYQAVNQFGTKVVPPKRILKMLPDLFDHQDEKVRASAKGLTIELCRWISKDTVKSILFEKMRETMKRELEVEVDNVTGLAKPLRKIRSEQLKEIEQEVSPEPTDQVVADDVSAAGVQETDDYELMDPVDILGPLGKTTFWEGVKATKWSERRDAVAELTKLASARRLAVGDYVEVSRTLKKLITDVNLAVAVEAVQAAGNLARGLRKDYSGGSRLLLPLLLERLKEKKQIMVDAVMQTLQTMHKSGCFGLGDVIEEVKVAAKNKVPSVRCSCLQWVTYCIETNNKAAIMKVYKEYVPILQEALTDGTPDVRNAAFDGIIALVKLIGMKPLEKSLEKLDDVRRKKLADLMSTEQPSNTPAAGPSKPSAGGVKSADAGFTAVGGSAASLVSGLNKRPLINKPVGKPGPSVKKKPEGGAKDASKAPARAEKVEENLDGGDVSPEDLETRIEGHFAGDIVTNLKSGKWQDRLEGLTTLQKKVEELAELDSLTETIVRFLAVLPGWGEKNFQVNQRCIDLLSFLAEKSGRFSKRCVVICLVPVAEKMIDIKCRLQAMKCLTCICEAVEPAFVVTRLLALWKDHKNPKVLQDSIPWLMTTMEEFGIAHIPVKELIAFCKDMLNTVTAPGPKSALVKLVGSLQKFCGPDVKNYFSDLKNASLQQNVNAEFDKNPYTGEVAPPKKQPRGAAVAAAGGGSEGGLPREDISGKITPAILKNFTSADWKVRQEAIEAVNTILQEANMRIQANGTGELIGALKGRLADSNKNLVIMTLASFGKVAQAMGPGFEKCFKVVFADVLKCLGDNKKMMREAAVKTLDAWLAVLQMSKMLSSLLPALLDAKVCADGRKDLFDWFAKNVAGADDKKEVLTLMKPALAGIQDKSGEVRKAAEGLLVEVVKACGAETVDRASRSLQGPALTLLQSLMEKHGLKAVSNHVEVVEEGPNRTPTRPLPQKQPVGSQRGRPVPARAGKEAKGEAADAAQQGQPLFHLKDCNKEDREKLLCRRPKFEDQKGEQIQDVEGDLVKFFREDLHRRLLSPDFKKQVEGVEMLQKALPSHIREMMDVMDVILRWTVVRVYEGNTTCLLKVLDFLQDLVLALKAESYSMTDCEASYIFPCLVEKSGHNSEKVREKFRELLRLLCCLYPSSKIFSFLVDGLRSKNNRTKIECVEQLGYLMERFGVEVGGSGKGLQAIVVVLNERDGELRKAALNTLAVAYQILGEDVWRHVGRVSEVQRSMMDEKFKWKAREMEKKKEGKPGEGRGALRRSPRENGADEAEQMAESNHQSISNMVSSAGSADRNTYSAAQTQPVGPLDWKDAIYVIEKSNVSEQVVEGMKVICYELEQAVGDADGILMEELVGTADRLVCSLSSRVASTFKAGLSGSSSRACKYVLNTLVQTFQIKRLAYEVKEETLHSLFTELLLWLLDDRVPQLDDGSQLLKALNVLVLKILENANRTSAFVVLIDLLEPRAQKGDRHMLSSHRFSDLVVKCLIKLTKVLASTIDEVDLDRLLQSIHGYFQQLGLEEIRKRAGADDKPLRMVKTVLHELVKLKGPSVKEYLSMVPIDAEPQPIILAYIELNLQTLAATTRPHMLAPAGTGAQGQWLENGGKGPSPNTTNAAETQLKQELAAIFKKIGDKQTCSVGLYELYRITQLYPHVDIFSQLQNASMAFRTYIRDGLAQIEKSAASGRTPASMSVVSPPPLTSPNMGYPSKGAANNNSSHIPSQHNTYGEDAEVTSIRPTSYAVDTSSVRQALQQRHIETSSYDTSGDSRSESNVHTSAGGGTLSAIRERMKSIQAAAAGGTGGVNYSIPSVGAVEPLSHRIPSADVEQRPRESIPDKALSGLQARMERLKNGVVEPAVLV